MGTTVEVWKDVLTYRLQIGETQIDIRPDEWKALIFVFVDILADPNEAYRRFDLGEPELEETVDSTETY